MKKLISFAIMLTMLSVLISAADVPTIPPLKNPETFYGETFIGDNSDGSEAVIFIMLDTCNDEKSSIANNGALSVQDCVRVGEDEFLMLNVTIQDSPYGGLIMCTMDLDEDNVYTYYMCGETVYYTLNGELTEKEPLEGSIDEYIENYHFPYIPLLLNLRGVYQDNGGLSYFLVRIEGDAELEYVVGDGMRILQTRLYELDENGDWNLTEFLDYDAALAVEIPENIMNEIAKDNTAK